MANGTSKDTIYVDIDDEITTIIDKVRSSDGKVIALVLPKRATVFQSVVNMKLLKRNAEDAKKHIVLITTEASLMPLAGSVGLHIASSLQSKPEIPQASEPHDDPEETGEPLPDEENDGYTAENSGDRPIGELAGDGMETLSLPDDTGDEPGGETKKAKSPFNKHLKVPNFNKFRRNLFLGVVALVLLVVGLYMALAVLPKAVITISTNANSVNVSLNMNLDTAANALDIGKMVVPAKTEQQQKTTTQQVATTGQKNNGATASGSITMTAQKCSGSGNPQDVPAGTGLSTNGLTFITQDDASFHITGFSNGCGVFTSGSTSIEAQSPGTKYNVNNASFTVAGRSDVSGTGSASGGTDNIIHVVAQADIDSAKQKLSTQDTSAIKASLEQTLRLDGMYPLAETFTSSNPIITTSNNVGDQSSNVTVTQAVTYTMFGAKQADLLTLIKNSINNQIDTKNQAILNDGLSSASVGVIGSSASAVQLSLQTTASVGPDINPSDIKKQAAGEKVGDVKSQINQISGVTKVDVSLSPFWVSSVPTNTSKITVTIRGVKQTGHGSG